MDVLRILGSTDLEVRKRTLDFLMSLISLRNVKDVVSLLKKEVIKTYSDSATDIDRESATRNLVGELTTKSRTWPGCWKRGGGGGCQSPSYNQVEEAI